MNVMEWMVRNLDEGLRAAAERPKRPMDATEEVLDIIRESPGITNEGIAEIVGVCYDVARKRTCDLVKAGKVTALWAGHNKPQQFQVANRATVVSQ